MWVELVGDQVIDDSAPLVREQGVLSLTGLDLVEIVRERRLEQLRRAWALDLELAHVRDVEDAGVAADGPMLGNHAFVLDRHLPARERHHPRAEGDVASVERRPLERLGHAGPMLTSAKRVPLRLGLKLRGSTGATDRVVGSTGEEEPQEGDPQIPRRAVLKPPGDYSSRRNDGTSRTSRGSSNVSPLAAVAGIGASSTSSRRRRRRPRAPKPVAITVTRTSSVAESSITAPKMTFAFWSAAFVTTSAASLTSKRPRSVGPVMLSRIPVAPSIVDSRSGDDTAVRAASLARFWPWPTPMPISAEPASRMIVLTSAKSRLTIPGTVIRSVMPWTPCRRTSSASLNASESGVVFSTTCIRRSFSITISVSTLSASSMSPCSACCAPRRPSNENGRATTPPVGASSSRPSPVATGARPVPVPPP